MPMSHLQALAAVVLAATVAGCDRAPSASLGAHQNPVTPPKVGRSACAGSVAAVAHDLARDVADRLEELQGLFESDPGFLAVVSDGREAVIVVEGDHLVAWRARLAPRGIAVAPSCVDPTLLALVERAAAAVSTQQGGTSTTGYDALDDAILVSGVDTSVLLEEMDRIKPGSAPAALAALTAGTLRIQTGKAPGGRN